MEVSPRTGCAPFQFGDQNGTSSRWIPFHECAARVTVSLFGGLGVKLRSPKLAFMFATVRNCSQPSATVRNRPQPFARTPYKALLMRECIQSVSKACQVDLWRRNCTGVCRGGVCVSDLWRRRYSCLCRGGVCVIDAWRRSLRCL